MYFNRAKKYNNFMSKNKYIFNILDFFNKKNMNKKCLQKFENL